MEIPKSPSHLPNLLKQIPSCKKCHGLSNPVSPWLPSTSPLAELIPQPTFGKLVLILPSPSPKDPESRLTISSTPSAVAIRNALRLAVDGIDPMMAYMTYLTKCPSNIPDDGTAQCVSTCMSNFLLPELKALEPDTIIVFGAKVFGAVAKRANPHITFANGRIIICPGPKKEVVICSMFHPRYYSYAHRSIAEFEVVFSSLAQRLNQRKSQ